MDIPGYLYIYILKQQGRDCKLFKSMTTSILAYLFLVNGINKITILLAVISNVQMFTLLIKCNINCLVCSTTF